MPEMKAISLTSMMGADADTDDLETARSFFETPSRRNVDSQDSMTSSHAGMGNLQKVRFFFVLMQPEGAAPDGYNFVSVLSAMF